MKQYKIIITNTNQGINHSVTVVVQANDENAAKKIAREQVSHNYFSPDSTRFDPSSTTVSLSPTWGLSKIQSCTVKEPPLVAFSTTGVALFLCKTKKDGTESFSEIDLN